MKKILLIGLEYNESDIEQATIETKGLGRSEICGDNAASALYEYDIIIINPQSYSHFLFGRSSEHSEAPKELCALKGENIDYDFDTIFDFADRMQELNIAISQGTKVIWLAVEDKREQFYGLRSLYRGYLNLEVKELLEHCWIQRKKAMKLKISRQSCFDAYFKALSQFGWQIGWDSESQNPKNETWLAESLEGYCLGREILLGERVAWVLTPPTSPESLGALIKCSLSDNNVALANQTKSESEVSTKYISSKEINSYVGNIKLLLITATEIETKTIRKYLSPLSGQEEILQGTIDDLTYRLGKFGAYDAVHFQCGMGTTGRDASTLSTYIATQCWKPTAVVMIGIAFGKDQKKNRLGDVLVSESITAYEPMRIGEKTIARGPTSLAGQILLDRFRNMLDWEYENSPSTKSKKIIGQMLSGDKLVDDQEFKDRLFELFPNAIGGEMEGAGIYAATTRANVPEWILVKGICDWGDGTKNKDYQALAADAATSLCHAVFSNPHSFKFSSEEIEFRTFHVVEEGGISHSNQPEGLPTSMLENIPIDKLVNKKNRYQNSFSLKMNYSERDLVTDLIIGLESVRASGEAKINYTLPNGIYIEKSVKSGYSISFFSGLIQYKLIIRCVKFASDEIGVEIVETL